jgi:hypothetical protein
MARKRYKPDEIVAKLRRSTRLTYAQCECFAFCPTPSACARSRDALLWIVGGRVAQGGAASPSQMARFQKSRPHLASGVQERRKAPIFTPAGESSGD